MTRNIGHISGWTYLGMVETRFHPELADLKIGESKTVSKPTQYILYMNRGRMVGQRKILNIYRRFKPKSSPCTKGEDEK